MTQKFFEKKPILIEKKEYLFKSQLFHKFTNIKKEGGLRTKNKFKKSYQLKPLISVITVVKNGEKNLKRCIESVQNQKDSNLEHIIIDGGSRDKTLDIIKKNSAKIDYWISEKDEGIYDAMNKGLMLANGKYIGILNSDDFYKKNSLKIIKKYFKDFKDLDYLFGTVYKKKILCGFWPQKIKWKFNIYSAHSVGFFIKKDSQKKVGLYDNNFRFCADRDLIYRLIKEKKFKGMATKKNELIGYFSTGGISESLSFFKKLIEETKIRIKNKQNILIVIILFLIHIIYQGRKFFYKN
jgi:glycosyltransferase involved in cell wall biosynthesis